MQIHWATLFQKKTICFDYRFFDVNVRTEEDGPAWNGGAVVRSLKHGTPADVDALLGFLAELVAAFTLLRTERMMWMTPHVNNNNNKKKMTKRARIIYLHKGLALFSRR